MKNKRVLFGTDGVRDVANKGGMTPEMALRLGRAFILFLEEGGVPRPRIVLGRDTRRSGMMLEGALSAGMTSAGAEVLSVGIVPTPGVSFGVKDLRADGGAVISASHNPAEYNGIKFLDHDGCKLTDDAELNIEEYLGDNLMDDWRPTGASIGEVRYVPDLVRDYAERLSSLLSAEAGKFSVVFDCAHGAAETVMPELLKRVRRDWTLAGAAPDGMNINDGVGVMHMEHLSRLVQDSGFPLGFAFDGDADRVLVADSQGRVIDGDIILWVLARWLAPKGLLGSGVAVTVMSNMALEGHLDREGIAVFRCPVGDRYVLDAMRHHGARLGGEQSGHIIADAFTGTGDGICTAMLFLNALHDLNEDASTLVDRFGRYAQKLSNLTLKSRALLDMDRVGEIAAAAQTRMGKEGRVFVRPSGTEPLLRILVEAREAALVEEMSELLVEQLKEFC
ncbi:MAG: phosphoglucosamine mutase [Synergistaceae bacterium]|nr:phosphoglucosamine mutase [Synergistaceae bacterium]